MFNRLRAKAAALVASAFAMLGCTSSPSTFGLDSGSATMVRRTCSEIMGLRVGLEAEACAGSLSDTMRVLQDASLTAQADQSCVQQGLAQGTAEHAKCVVTLRRTMERSSVISSMEHAAVPEAQPWQSYFSMSRLQQEESTELACAQLGLYPASGTFWHCVSDLKFAIANIRYETMP